MFKIIEDKDNYKFVDSVTEELFGNFSKSGFSKERAEWYLEKFNKDPDLYWKGFYSRDLRVATSKEEIERLESLIKEL